MSVPDRAYAQLLATYRYDRGRFYGSAEGLDLGVGLVYRNAVFPTFNEEARAYDTLAGYAYIMSHECDVDQNNQRHFNDEVLAIPVLPFDDFVNSYLNEHSEGALFAFIDNLAKDEVSRVIYIPSPSQYAAGELPKGGVLYLNSISPSPVSHFGNGGATAVCALSTYGLQIVDYKLQHHFLRPKAQRLPRLR